MNLVPFDADCITEEYLSWLNNSELMKYSRQSRFQHTRESCLDFLKGFENSKNHFWSVRDANNVQVGTMSAYVDSASGVADLGIMIGVTGNGYGKKAWGSALKFLFENDHLRKVTAGTLCVHEKMIKIFDHWSMLQEGYLRKQEFLNGITYDVVRYGLLKEEWNLANERTAHDISKSKC